MIRGKHLKFFIPSIVFILSDVYCDEKSSLTFVIDDTGSMSDDIEQVKIGTNAIFDTVMNSNKSQIEDFVLVTFNDPYTKLRTITKDRNEFKSALSEISVGGGGLCPEYSISGIITGIENSRPGSTIYVFTDASAEDHKQYEKAKNMAIKKQIQVVFVLTGICDTKSTPDYIVYKKLAYDTLGQIFHLGKHDVLDILEYVKENLKGRRTILATKTFPSGSHFFNVTDNGDTKDMIVSLTGDNPELEIFKPDGVKAGIRTIVKKPNINVAKVVPPKPPGVYKVNVKSDSESHVIVSATSDINFKHGFSTFKPSSIEETATIPLPDVKSHITIKLTDGNIELKTVQILDMHDNLINEIPLVALNEIEKLYTTELEELPKTMFKIAITGYDPETHATIMRTGLPITTPSVHGTVENKAPKVSILGSSTLKVELDKPLQLKCKVNGYPKPDIVWVNKNSGEEMPATVSMVEIPDVFISTLDIDRTVESTNYQCKATNSIGSEIAEISVETTAVPYFNILEKPRDAVINYRDEGELHCKVDAYPPATITWYKDNRPLMEDDNLEFSDDNTTIRIKEMHISDDGSYVCEMRNEYNRKITMAKVTIIGIETPVINSSIMAIAVSSGTDAVISCNIIQGFPKPTITWYYSNYSGEIMETLEEWNDQEVITIRNAVKNKSGTYSCAANNEAGDDYHEVELTIEYPPEIEEDLNEKRVAEGDSVTMSCYVEGKPDPVVTWYKDGVPLTRSDKIYIYRDHSIGMKVGLDDMGTYTCKATNKLGTASKAVKLYVYVPVTITLPKVTKMDVRVGATLNLPCQANGYPKPDTEWTYLSFNSSVSKSMMKSHGASIMRLKDMRTDEEGYYTCSASNSVGSTNASYEIHVLAPPAIANIYLDKKFKVVEGDLVAMIKCNASGNPPPTIKWLKNGYLVAAGDDITIEKETIIVKNVNKDAEGVYVCEAMNSLGFDRDVYEIIVAKSPQPGHPTSTILTREGTTTTVGCDVPHKRTDQLRWYKNGVLIQTGELTLRNAKVTDSGLYTCRVSDFTKSTSGNTLVKVGMKPRFVRDEEENHEYVESVPCALSCETTGDPQPQLTWWHNGEIMNITQNYHYFEMEVGTQGEYVCEARNEFGTITRSFNVISKDCFINIKKQPSKLQPLMLSSRQEWPQINVKNGYMSIAKDEYVVLLCPNRFKSSPRSYNLAFCEGGTKFKIRGKSHEYSNIECTEKMTHSIEKTGESCFGGNTELLRVVFKVLSETIETYEVCLDTDNDRPLYTTMRMRSSVADVNYLTTEWADDDVIDLNIDDAYECNRQTSAISSMLGRWFHKEDGCCFGKRMLVSPRDLFPGVAQRAAYSHLNVVPHWSTCNAESNNWNDVEQRVRSLAKATSGELVVSTGVSEDLTLPDIYKTARDIYVIDSYGNTQSVPKYLWKVVQDPSTKSSLVIIQVNVPDLLKSEAAAYVRCRDICNTTKWMRGSSWYDVSRGFTYCCTLNDFEKSFGYNGVFQPYNGVLSDVSLIPEYSLT